MLTSIDLGSGLEDGWSSLMTAVPKVLSFIVILIIGSIIARIAARIARRLLGGAPVQRVMERAGLGQQASARKLNVAGIGGRIVKAIVMIVALATAASVFGPDNPLSAYLSSIIAFIPRLIVAIAILVITSIAVRWVTSAVQGAGRSMPGIITKAVGPVIWVVGVFAALDQLQVAPNVIQALLYATLAAAVGIAVVAIGGGGIGPMRKEWTERLDQARTTRSRIGEHSDHQNSNHSTLVNR